MANCTSRPKRNPLPSEANSTRRPPPSQFNFDIPATDTREAPIPDVDITMEELRAIISSFTKDTAPGLSGITYALVKWAFDADPDGILEFYKLCIKRGVHPKAFKAALVVVVPKPSKADYTNPRAYRPIALIECLGKILEKIVAKRLDFFAEHYGLVNRNQFGARTGSSTTDAGLSLTHDVHTAWKNDLVLSTLNFDIKGYFDFVRKSKLCEKLYKKNIPLNYVQWVHSFLSDRMVTFSVDNIRGTAEPVDNGIPQGSPVSPVLSSYFSSDLLELFTSADIVFEDYSEKPVAAYLYVDDGQLRATSNSIANNCRILELAYGVVGMWMTDNFLQLDKEKRELMHFSRRQRDSLHRNPDNFVTLPNFDRTQTVHKPCTEVRWLGIYFDPKLNFKNHVKIMCDRARASVNALSILGNSQRGTGTNTLRNVYNATVPSVLTYASPVWFTGHRQKTLIQPITVVQNAALRRIAGVFRTTNVAALEALLSIPPIHSKLMSLNYSYASRLNSLSPSHPILFRLPPSWKRTHAEFPYPTHPASPLVKLASHGDPKGPSEFKQLLPPWDPPLTSHPDISTEYGKRWFEKHKTTSAAEKKRYIKLELELTEIDVQNARGTKRGLVCFTDGSFFEGNAGGAFVFYHSPITFPAEMTAWFGHTLIPMGPMCSAYDAEMLALVRAAEDIVNRLEHNAYYAANNHVMFCFDNQGAVQALLGHTPKTNREWYYRFKTRHPSAN
jgi:hypothetical protein